MKKISTIAFILLASLSLKAQEKRNAQPYQTRSLSAANIKQVFVNTSGGSITVTGTDASQARLEVYVAPSNYNEDISKEELLQRLADNYDLKITDTDHELHATAKRRSGILNWRKALSISFKVYVPKAVATMLNTSGGAITLTDLDGDQEFSTSGGRLHLMGLNGHIKGSTSGGSIDVSNCKQDIELVTSGGSIRANDCEGKMELTTSGGALKLSGLKGMIEASTSGGSINAEDIGGELRTSTSGGSINLSRLNCSVDASTSGGSIHAQFEQVGKFVKLNTSAGHIDLLVPADEGLNLDLRGSRVNADLAGTFKGIKQKNRLEGEYNGGGATVSVRSSGGGVNLKMN